MTVALLSPHRTPCRAKDLPVSGDSFSHIERRMHLDANPWIQLHKRTRTMHALWQRAVSDMTVEQINYQERAGVLPIAFSLLHYVQGEDRNISQRILGSNPLWDDGGWAAKTGIASSAVPRGTAIEVAEQVRIGDLEAWREYQSAVFAQTEDALASLPAERFAEVLFESVPDSVKGGFLAGVAGDGPVYLGDMMDVFLYQHGIRHIGEIEHARSLVGLTGF